MKSEVYKLLIKTYLEYCFPLTGINYEGKLNEIFESNDLDIIDQFFRNTIKLIEFYKNRIWFDKENLEKTAVNLVFRFIEQGKNKDALKIFHLYKVFTSPISNVNHKNRKFFEVTDKVFKLLNMATLQNEKEEE